MEGFLESVNASSAKAREFGREMALAHYVKIAGVKETEAEALYIAIREVAKKSILAIQVKNDDVETVLRANKYAVLTVGYNLARRQTEVLMGCNKLRPIYAEYKIINTPKDGYCLLILGGKIDAIVFNGDPMRIRNSERQDYVPDAKLLTYAMSDFADCKASSLMCGLRIQEAVLGSDRILEKIADGEFDCGLCPVLIFSDIGSGNLKSITSDSDMDAIPIRKIVSSLDSWVQVHVSGGKMPLIGTDMHTEKDERLLVSTISKYMKPGDRVALKPIPSQARLLGKVIEANGNIVSVHWDNDTKSIYDAAEALMRIMPAPSSDGVAFLSVKMDGMSQETQDSLTLAGIDSETIYSLMSHFQPVTSSAGGWQHKAIDGLTRFGLSATEIDGYKEDGDHFSVVKWIEAKLPTGDRLIVDMSADKLCIEAGDAEDYIIPVMMPSITME